MSTEANYLLIGLLKRVQVLMAFTEGEPQVNNLPPPKQLSRFEKGMIRLAVEGGGFGLATGLEIARGALVNPKVFGKAVEEIIKKPAILNPDTIIYQVLQNSGDFYDGFVLSFVLFNGIDLVDSLQSAVTRHRIPLQYKLGTTVALISALVPLVELGILTGNSTGDFKDIPAGLLGILAYAGVNLLGRKLAELPPRYRDL